MKLLYVFLFISISCLQKQNDDFDKMITDLGNLEKYIKEYISEKSYTEKTLTHLIVCYIRLGAYSTSEWTIAGGSLPDDLVQYIASKDEEKGTSAQATQTYRDMQMPNGDMIDFVHMFAVMNGIENGDSYSQNFAHLVGWGGDTEQLLEDIMNEEGDLEYLMEFAKANYFRIKGGLDEADLISDLDGPILLYNKNDNNNFADLLKDYYSNDECKKNRVSKFYELTFPSLIDVTEKETLRNELYKIYNSDTFIKVLECQKGMRDEIMSCFFPSEIKQEYLLNQKASVYVVSDFFFDNIKPSPGPEEEEEESREKEEEKEEEKEKEKEEEKEEEKEKENEKEEEKEEEEEKEKEEEKEDESEDSDTTSPDNNASYMIYFSFWILLLLF